MTYNYRVAKNSDVKRILDIYTPYITDSLISFEIDVPSLEEFQARFKDIASFYPFIVCESNNQIIGFAYAHQYMERAAYQWDAELSIYIDQSFHGTGIGQNLYLKLFELLKLQNIINVYGCVTSPNPKSDALHKKLGFKTIGVFSKTGYKFGQWIDVTWYEKTIGSHSLNPEPVISFQDILIDEINEILT